MSYKITERPRKNQNKLNKNKGQESKYWKRRDYDNGENKENLSKDDGLDNLFDDYNPFIDSDREDYIIFEEQRSLLESYLENEGTSQMDYLRSKGIDIPEIDRIIVGSLDDIPYLLTSYKQDGEEKTMLVMDNEEYGINPLMLEAAPAIGLRPEELGLYNLAVNIQRALYGINNLETDGSESYENNIKAQESLVDYFKQRADETSELTYQRLAKFAQTQLELMQDDLERMDEDYEQDYELAA